MQVARAESGLQGACCSFGVLAVFDEGALKSSYSQIKCALPAFELAAAEQGVDITRRADGGLKPLLGHRRIERDRRADDVEIGFGRKHKAFGTVTRGAGAQSIGERLRLFDVLARRNAGGACELRQIESRIGQRLTAGGGMDAVLNN